MRRSPAEVAEALGGKYHGKAEARMLTNSAEVSLRLSGLALLEDDGRCMTVQKRS